LFYQIVGAAFGAVILAAFPTPRNFRYGVLVAAIWSKCA
jgi:hypothetical protein